jgi:hypothetical protein
MKWRVPPWCRTGAAVEYRTFIPNSGQTQATIHAERRIPSASEAAGRARMLGMESPAETAMSRDLFLEALRAFRRLANQMVGTLSRS